MTRAPLALALASVALATPAFARRCPHEDSPSCEVFRGASFTMEMMGGEYLQVPLGTETLHIGSLDLWAGYRLGRVAFRLGIEAAGRSYGAPDAAATGDNPSFLRLGLAARYTFYDRPLGRIADLSFFVEGGVGEQYVAWWTADGETALRTLERPDATAGGGVSLNVAFGEGAPGYSLYLGGRALAAPRPRDTPYEEAPRPLGLDVGWSIGGGMQFDY